MAEMTVGRWSVHVSGSSVPDMIGVAWDRLRGGWCFRLQVWPRRVGVAVAWWQERRP